MPLHSFLILSSLVLSIMAITTVTDSDRLSIMGFNYEVLAYFVGRLMPIFNDEKKDHRRL